MNSLRLLIALWLGITFATASVSQVLEHPVTVPVEFEGSFNSNPGYNPSTFIVSVGGGSASGYGWQQSGWLPTTRAVGMLRPGKSYDIAVSGVGVYGFKIHFNPPSGYRVIVADQDRLLYRADTTPVNGGTIYVSIRVEGGDAVSYMPAGDSTGLSPRNVVWQVGLGSLMNGKGAGSIGFREDGISGSIGTRAALFYDSACSEVEIITMPGNAELRQVSSNQTLVDITDEIGGVRLSFYPQGAYTLVNGAYDVSGATPFVAYTVIKNTSATFTITKIIGAKQWQTRVEKPDATHWNLIDWTENINTPVRKEERAYSVSGSLTYEDIIVKDGSNVVATVLRRTFQDFGSGWGKELVSETHGYGTVDQTSTYTYHTTPSQIGNYRKIKSITRPDGSWEQYTYYDDLDRRGMLKETFEPFQDNPTAWSSATAGNCRYTAHDYSIDHTGKNTRLWARTEFTNGALTGEAVISYQDIIVNGEPVVTATRDDYSDPTTYRRTISEYYREDADLQNHWYPQMPRMSETASGQRTVYAYTPGRFEVQYHAFLPNVGNEHVQEVIIHGSNSSAGHVPVSSWNGQAIDTIYVVPNKSWMEENIRGATGTIYYKAVYVADVSGNFVRVNGLLTPHLDGRYKLYEWDDYGRYHNQWTWEHGRIKRHTDSSGVVTEYAYDLLGRVSQRKRLSMGASAPYPAVGEFAIDFEYDGDHRVRRRREGATPQPTFEWQYDQAGRVISASEPGIGATTIKYPSAREVRYELPGPYMVNDAEFIPGTDAQKRYYVDEHWLDGMFKRRTGNAAAPAYSYLYLDTGNPAHGRILRQDKRSEFSNDEWKNQWFDWLGRTTQAFEPSYLEDGNPNAITVVNHQYCGCGRLEKTSFTSNAFGTIGAPIKYDYDAMGNLRLRVGDIDQDNQIDYDQRDRLETIDTSFQPIGGAWWLVEKTTTYPKMNDTAERRVRETRTKLSNFAAGQLSVTHVIDAPGNTTETVVRVETSGRRRFMETTYPDSSTMSQSIWVNGLLWRERSRTGAATRYAYDSNDRITTITRRDTVSEFLYYIPGTTLVHQKSSSFFVTDSFEYDSAGRIKLHRNADNKTARFAYDTMGNLTHRWGETVQPVKHQFNAYGRRTHMWTYQDGTNWANSAWPVGATGTANQTQWIYQAKTGLLTEKQDASSHWVRYEYNIRHQLAKKTEQRASGWNTVTNYAYWEGQDPSSPSYFTGALKTVDYSDINTADLQFEYDRLGRLKKVSDATVFVGQAWRELTYQDDDPNPGAGIYANLQLEKEILPSFFYGTRELRRRYQASVKGRYEGFDFGPVGSVMHSNTYQFQGTSGRISDVLSAGGPSWTYAYGSGSDLVVSVASSTWQRNNVWANWRDFLESSTLLYNSSAVTARHFTESHQEYADPLGRRLYVKLSGLLPRKLNAAYLWGTWTDFEFNDRNEITSADGFQVSANGEPGAPISGRYREWRYDHAMNRKEQWTTGSPPSAANSTYTRNNLDQITAVVGQGSAAISNDWSGNITDDGTWLYYYDAENRPYRMSHKTQNFSLFFTYDYLGRRVHKRVGYYDDGWEWTSEIKYVYDGWNLVAETDNGGALIRTYTWGTDVSGSLQGAGGVGGLLHFTEGGLTYIPIYDLSHNIVGWSRQSDGAIMSATAFSPFGEILQHWEDPSFAGKAKFGFSTKFTDSETGLVYYGYRYYHPKLGRFINRDPIGEAGGLNLYALVGNNPVNKLDVLGLWQWCFTVPDAYGEWIDTNTYRYYDLRVCIDFPDDVPGSAIPGNGDQGSNGGAGGSGGTGGGGSSDGSVQLPTLVVTTTRARDALRDPSPCGRMVEEVVSMIHSGGTPNDAGNLLLDVGESMREGSDPFGGIDGFKGSFTGVPAQAGLGLNDDPARHIISSLGAGLLEVGGGTWLPPAEHWSGIEIAIPPPAVAGPYPMIIKPQNVTVLRELGGWMIYHGQQARDMNQLVRGEDAGRRAEAVWEIMANRAGWNARVVAAAYLGGAMSRDELRMTLFDEFCD